MSTEESKEKKKQYNSKYYLENQDYIKLKNAIYKESHPEESHKACSKYYYNNKEELSKKKSVYYENNREEILSRKRERNKNPEVKNKNIAKGISRRALGRITTEQILILQNEFGGLCPYCGKEIVVGNVDHIIPIIKGGTNDFENLIWCCRKCNNKKQSKNMHEFMKTLYNMEE